MYTRRLCGPHRALAACVVCMPAERVRHRHMAELVCIDVDRVALVGKGWDRFSMRRGSGAPQASADVIITEGAM